MSEEKVTMQGILVAVLVVGLFFGLMGIFFTNLGAGYNIDGYVGDKLGQFNNVENMSQMLQDVNEQKQNIGSDPNIFDVIGNLIQKALSPIKFIVNSVSYVYDMAKSLVSIFNLPSIFTQFFVSMLLIVIVVGIFIIKYAMGKEK